MADTNKCKEHDCTRDARMALDTTRSAPTGTLKTTVFWDDREGTKKSAKYCKAHGVALLTSMASLLVHGDNTSSSTTTPKEQ